MRDDQPVKTYWVSPSPGVRWLCKEYFDKQIELVDEEKDGAAIPEMVMAEPSLVPDQPAIPTIHKGEDMSVDTAAQRLNETVASHMDKLTSKIDDATKQVDEGFSQAHQNVDAGVSSIRNILNNVNNALSKLPGVLQTNNPPPGDLPT